jgi:endonuclease-3
VSPATADRRRVRAIHRRLEKAFGPLDPPRHTEPLEELVLTVLSQNTSDTNSSRAYGSLRRRFPEWAQVARASEASIAAAIRSGGLANTKAPRIRAIVREIAEREDGFDLSWMRSATDDEVFGYLVSLPGVGAKTAACVLAFSLARDAIPVDTHVERTSKRLDLVREEASATRAYQELSELIPDGLRLRMHVGLIRLGREVCKAGRPRCEECPLADICPTAPIYLGHRVPTTRRRRVTGSGQRAPR